MAPRRAISLALLALATTLAISPGDAAVVEYTFRVANLKKRSLCKSQVITVVNKQLPGPTIDVTEGDTLVVYVINESPYGVTIHWHGIRQLLNCWADGTGMITQCPIRPNSKYIYRFNVTGQEGTLWWHAHTSLLRLTVHGALIIRPTDGPLAYPFHKPDEEIPIILGDLWELNFLRIEREIKNGIFTGRTNFASAVTINGKQGDLYNCSGVAKENYILDVDVGKTYLLRIINVALYAEFFFKVAGHTFTVVAVDASYIKPYKTDLIVIAAGQTVDVLMVADAPPSKYYMVVKNDKEPPPNFQIPTSITRGVVRYRWTPLPSLLPIIMPEMPDDHDLPASFHFHGSLTSLAHPKQPLVPLHVDEHMFISLGLGALCRKNSSCKPTERIVVASMNNVSFHLPTKTSMLEAHYYNVEGVYTSDFPNRPPKFFNFTDQSLIQSSPREDAVEMPSKGTKVKRLKYNTTVEVVLQGTAIRQTEAHPIHLHGYNFFVLAQGIGNYNAKKAKKEYNLVDPPLRNTVAVPVGGWAVIRFVADNPGMWVMHCHIENHVTMGMAFVFEVENGQTRETTLPPPPPEFQRCHSHDLAESLNTYASDVNTSKAT